MEEYLLKYETLINTSDNKEEISKIVNKMFLDTNISDIDFHNILEEIVYPKLKQLGCDIQAYNEEKQQSCIETILKEDY